MNILIVGNGFDLSHYLPTKYDHFIEVMEALKAWDTSKGHMYFDDLYSSLEKADFRFFSNIKKMYCIERLSIDSNEIEKIKKTLTNNIWYRYFLNHINQIDTWIDFELEFANALDVVAKFSEEAEKIYAKYESLRPRILPLGHTTTDQTLMRLGKKTIEKLQLLDILILDDNGIKINVKYYRNNKLDLDVDSYQIIKNLEKNLHEFIDLFKWYLKEIIENLDSKDEINKNIFDFDLEDLMVISFNYTSTFSRLYSAVPKIEYVHGEVNKELVLGILDIKNEFLKKFKNYSFTKYHQKLLKNTDYLFLDENPKINRMFGNNALGKRDINIYIWGHSLADSDESYIHEIFSLNRKSSIECYVTVYFYENDAPRLLNNLLDILGKDKVEQWMKKGWLKFKPHPEINFQIKERAELGEVS